MRRAPSAAALLLALAACAKAPSPKASALERAARGVPSGGACAREIPEEWGMSWPVPARRDGRLVYRVFFFGWQGGPRAGISDRRAQGEATFAPDGTVLDCRRSGGRAPLLPREKARPSVDDGASRLYALTEEVGGLYASGRPAPADRRRTVAAYCDLLAALSAPGHAPDYRELSPDFWNWAAKNGGTPPGAGSP